MIRMYKPEDESMIRAWYEARGMTLNASMLPKVGFICPGLAAGWLLQTDTKIAILEPFIANPNADKYDRDEALNKLLVRLELMAGQLGYTHVYGFSTSPTMIKRALDLGFKVLEKRSTTVNKEVL